MFIIIDIIIVAIIASCIFFGYKKGLTGVLFNILSFFISFVVAFILFKPVANYVIDNTQIDENIQKSMVSIIHSDETNEEKDKMPNVIMQYINETIEEASNDMKENVVQSASQNVAITIINIGVWILLFVIIKIVLIFVKAISELISNLPVIKQFDKLGGIIYGILKGFIILFFIFAILSFIAPMAEKWGIIQMVNQSLLGSLFYHNNLLLSIIF